MPKKDIGMPETNPTEDAQQNQVVDNEDKKPVEEPVAEVSEAAPAPSVSEDVEPELEEDPDVEPELSPEELDNAVGLTEAEFDELRSSEVAFSWQASEYVHHHKGAAWYATLAGVVTSLIVLAVLLKFWLSILAFVAMGAAIYVYAHKPPRTLMYELSPKGITVEGRFFPFKEFRSFGVLPDIEWHTIDLEPTRRFFPRMTLLFDDDDFDEIVGHLELHLPRIDRKPDVIERATRYLRF